IIIDAGAATFAHEHAEVEGRDGRPVFALPGQRFGPRLNFHARFGSPGLYRIWAQVKTAAGHVVTAAFTVNAR
ncbi:MAG: hypothetical protein LBV34_19895, partial [Nocardiopsaceae bacterium]|nr:hypothetical protein [Nocardiopsaceae bacterium]